VIGIDPGLSGAVAVLTLDGTYLASAKLPTIAVKKGNQIDILTLARGLDALRTHYDVRLFVIEEPQLRGKQQGILATHTQGRAYGRLEAYTELHQIPCEIVHPKVWQAAVLGKITHDKKVAMAYVGRRYPDAELRPGRCTKAQDGIADAICLAEYGRRLLLAPSPVSPVSAP
jgi:Holliday junction resolvasome RuvABC endonuclease subunit